MPKKRARRKHTSSWKTPPIPLPPVFDPQTYTAAYLHSDPPVDPEVTIPRYIEPRRESDADAHMDAEFDELDGFYDMDFEDDDEEDDDDDLPPFGEDRIDILRPERLISTIRRFAASRDARGDFVVRNTASGEALAEFDEFFPYFESILRGDLNACSAVHTHHALTPDEWWLLVVTFMMEMCKGSLGIQNQRDPLWMAQPRRGHGFTAPASRPDRNNM